MTASRLTCDACGDDAAVDLGDGFHLCARCEEIVRREFPNVAATLKISDPAVASPGETAVTTFLAPALVVAAITSPIVSARGGVDGHARALLADSGGNDGEARSAPSLVGAKVGLESGPRVSASPVTCDGESKPDVTDAVAGRGLLNFETEVSELEAEWSRAGVNLSDDPLDIPAFLRRSPDNVAPFNHNSNSLRVRAESEIAASSVA